MLGLYAVITVLCWLLGVKYEEFKTTTDNISTVSANISDTI